MADEVVQRIRMRIGGPAKPVERVLYEAHKALRIRARNFGPKSIEFAQDGRTLTNGERSHGANDMLKLAPSKS